MRDDFTITRWRSYGEFLARRRMVFAVAYLGYAACYFVRNNVAVVSEILTREMGWTAPQVGAILSGFTMSYGIGKLVMGVVVDRYSLRGSFALGLGGSALVCISMSFMTDPLHLTLALVLIGFLQGACSPAALAMLGAWYPGSQRDARVAVWNTSQNLGAAALPMVISGGLALTGPSNWTVGFWLPGLVALAAALWSYRFGGERPWQEDMPTLTEVYPNEAPPTANIPPAGVSYWTLVRVHVLGSRVLALLLALNALLYLLRFGILNWIPIFLITERGLDQETAALTMSAFEWGAIPGALAFAYIAWRLPNKNATAAAFAMAVLAVTVVMYATATSPHEILLTAATLGALVYGPQVIINILTLKFISPRAIGVAVGWVGLGGYLVGALTANTAVPHLADAVGWPLTFGVLAATGAASLILCLRLRRIEMSVGR